MKIIILLLFLSLHIQSELVVNVKNKGDEITQIVIKANTTYDIIDLAFLNVDGTHVRQFIDIRNELQIIRVIIPPEEELLQKNPVYMCFVLQFMKNEFISSDAMSKLRQKNPTAIRNPEEEKELTKSSMDLSVDLNKSSVLSPFIKDVCQNAASLTYAIDSELRMVARYPIKDYGAMLSSVKILDIDNLIECADVYHFGAPCLCHYKICIGWYPCGLKYCRGKDSSGKIVNYRCGIKTCRKCRSFYFPVEKKYMCLWDYNNIKVT